MAIIHTIYEATQDYNPSPRERGALEKLLAYQDKVQAAFGLDFLNEMIDAQNAMETVSMSDAYERGFTDCFQLWLEVFSKYSS